MFERERIRGGFFAAILAAAAAPALAALQPLLLIASLPVAALHAVLLGLPLYMVLSRRREPGLALSAAAGFVTGMLPVLALELIVWPPPLGDIGALLGGAESGRELSAGLERWAQWLAAPVFFGGCGAVGGAAFWLVAIRRVTGPRYGEDEKSRRF
jgi:hypothetical protein